MVALLVCLPSLWPQSPTNERLTVGQPTKVTGKRGETVHARIPISILPGYHVNSNTPSEDYLIPLALKWTPATLGALEGGEVVYPKATSEKYSFAEKPLSVYTGNFEMSVTFKVSATAAAGPGVAVGKLTYQACNDRSCFPPKTVEVSVPYAVQ